VQDWDEEDYEDEVVEEGELIRVQHETERLRQEQESIVRRQEATQCAEARRQHINRRWARLNELQYSINILR
jgi:hypothetical protein